MNWTEEQKRVIDFRSGNLLVSAAAGSGKTAVLVEHILRRISDPAERCSVTELLVVTFTRAAAAEMKERLSDRLLERLEREPENRHLARQIPLLPQAQICTIDSFCQWLVKNYYYELDIDPDFRLMEEGEGRLLREDILEELMEDSFREAEEDFLHLIDAFGSARGERAVRELILRLALFCESELWPMEWLKELRDSYDGTIPSPSREGWLMELEQSLRERLDGLAGRLRGAVREAEDGEGLERYGEMFRGDLAQVRELQSAGSLGELMERLGELRFSRKPALPKKAVFDAKKKEELSAERDRLKKQLQSLGNRYAMNLDDTLEAQAATDACRRALVDQTIRFLERYREEKRRRNLADFSDVEHWALELLVRRKEGVSVPTALAEDLGRNFREILIDEYQDSNLVQETILQALSGESRGMPNRFLVGDVKQSIYKFRMARPELFLEKYRSYSYATAEGAGQKIDLGKNFRSRETILQTVNRVFERIMGEGLGGIAYDEHAALYPGASLPAPDSAAELLVLETGDSEEDARESEARMIAGRIRALTAPESEFRLWDGSKNVWRRAEYRDIVILLRSMEGWAEPFAQVLNQEGIPAAAQLKTGYFAAREIQVLLNFLRVLDNPLQDIPLLSVMLSPLGDFTSEDVAQMSAGMPEGTAWERMAHGAELGRGKEKWERFADRIARFRRAAAWKPIHELLEEALEETDYRLILAAQPDGRVRLANVDMLLEQALRYEETSYHGIFQFLRYMDQLQRYEVDFGEAQVLSEQENLVRITSIHKSKGLEYPVVIVAGCGKRFNRMDTFGAMLIHEELGLACDYIDAEEGIRYPVLWKKFVADRMEREIKGEELRILYVAMTRAKEKLILTAAAPDLAGLRSRWQWISEDAAGVVSPLTLLEGNSFLDWLLMSGAGTEGHPLLLREVSAEQMEAKKLSSAGNDLIKRSLILEMTKRPASDQSAWREVLDYAYPWQEITGQKTAYSVSELKHRAAEQFVSEYPLREESGQDTEKARREEALWANPEDGSVPLGALRGTAYHTVMEHISPAEGVEEERVRERLKELTNRGILTEQERDWIRPERIAAFCRSYLGQVAARADAAGRFHREQPFVMQVLLSEVMEVAPERPDLSGEWVLVQGIIDAFAETEDGELILWDYKTDAVSEPGGQERLLGLYSEQLNRYKSALERARGQRVREMWLYSFALGREIRVPDHRLK